MRTKMLESIDPTCLGDVTGGQQPKLAPAVFTFQSTPEEIQQYGECERKIPEGLSRDLHQAARSSCFAGLIGAGVQRKLRENLTR
jgi:hypothetical protein